MQVCARYEYSQSISSCEFSKWIFASQVCAWYEYSWVDTTISELGSDTVYLSRMKKEEQGTDYWWRMEIKEGTGLSIRCRIMSKEQILLKETIIFQAMYRFLVEDRDHLKNNLYPVRHGVSIQDKERARYRLSVEISDQGLRIKRTQCGLPTRWRIIFKIKIISGRWRSYQDYQQSIGLSAKDNDQYIYTA